MSKRKPQAAPQADSSKIDRATDYARAVSKKKIVAGPHVRAACRRHLKDLREGKKRGLRWDLGAARHAIEYFEEVLHLNGGKFEGVPFKLLPWQAFVVGSLFGWKGADGFRRFRVAYVETGKGSGKSPLAAGVGLFGLTADDEERAEIYAAATKKDQAQILFRDAIAMYEHSPELAARLVTSGAKGKEFNLAYHASSSFFRTIAADDGQSGPRPHMALIDEVHEHKSSNVIDMMVAGTKSREQSLIFMITNSGTDKTGICWDYHDLGRQVCAGVKEDDSFFAFVCGLDEGDDPFKDETCWVKANPSLEAGVPGFEYLRKQVTRARNMPSRAAVVKRLNFCIWTEGDNPWIGYADWNACEERIDEADLQRFAGRSGVAGLDLSSTQDLTALVVALDPVPEDPVTRLIPFFWLPGDDLEEKGEKDRVPYSTWREAGYLEALPGKAVNKKAVLKRAAKLTITFDLRAIYCDRWRVEDFEQLIDDEGVALPPLLPFGQGYKDMAPAIDEFETRLLERTVRHDGNPVMTWCAANAVVKEDEAGNRKIVKRRATGRVDGVVAAVMAIGGTLGEQHDENDLDDFLKNPIIA